MKTIVLGCVLALLLGSWFPKAINASDITDIEVKGAIRISVETVMSYMPIGIGDKLDEANSGEIIKALFATGFFEDVRLEVSQGVLTITVEERPTIASIKIVGNKVIDDDELTERLGDQGITEGKLFSKYSFERALAKLQEEYISYGRYGATVNSAINPDGENSVDLYIEIEEGPVARVRSITFLGNKVYSSKELRAQSSFSGNWVSNLILGTNKFSQEKLDSDEIVLRNFYLDSGFVNVSLSQTIVDIAANNRDVSLTFKISEGSRHRIGKVVLDETNALPSEESKKLIEINQGMIFSRSAIIRSRMAIEQRLGDMGHAFGNVNPVPSVDKESNTIDIVFVIEPGPQVYVRRVNISGNSQTQDVVIRREMRQEEGAIFSGQKLIRSQERIHRLGFFDEVSVKLEPVTGESDEVDINIEVAERKTGNLLLGIGYSDDEQGFFQAEISRKNLFGSGRELNVSLDQSQVKQIYELEYTNPYFTSNGISRGFYARQKRVNSSYRDTGSYIANSSNIGVNFSIPTSEYNALNVSGGYEKMDLLSTGETPAEYAEFITQHPNDDGVIVSLGYSRDTRDRILFPSKGFLSSLSAETTVPGSNAEYYKVSFSGRWYSALSETFVLGLGAEIGYGGSFDGASTLPFYKNFFAGGTSSVRGYRSGSLGPRSGGVASGAPLGGSRRLLTAANLYFPVPGLTNGDRTRLSIFVDGGQVYGVGEEMSLAALKISAGVSFNWSTAIGPLALSYGIPLNAERDDQTRKFQITFGRVFQ